jgi:hypothetical protein
LQWINSRVAITFATFQLTESLLSGVFPAVCKSRREFLVRGDDGAENQSEIIDEKFFLIASAREATWQFSLGKQQL